MFETFNISHTIKGLSFGTNYPGLSHPLDGASRTVEDGHGMYQYYIKAREQHLCTRVRLALSVLKIAHAR